jgi:hypothetical protein
MPPVIQGELVRHHNQPFYAQKGAPKYFWAGCLTPGLVILAIALLALHGLQSAAGLLAVRGYLLVIFAFLILQFVLGGGMFWRQRSSLAKGLLIGSISLFLLTILSIIGLFSLVQNFVK